MILGMHMADALISPTVAMTAGLIAAILLGIAGWKINKQKETDGRIVPLMGILGAFIFAAQMINFTIPGTGSSGHIIGGILLAAFLGPWAAFITLSSVLIIQCFIFADGGLMALGCNIINMAAMSTLLAYPLIFRPLVKRDNRPWMICIATISASVVGLELGACAVTAETVLSGVTALPPRTFLMLMTGIHLAIGIAEGIATSAILLFVMKTRPALLPFTEKHSPLSKTSLKKALIGFGAATLVLGGGIAFMASEYPDGLEWSIEKITGSTQLSSPDGSIVTGIEKVQHTTSLMPDYDNSLSGIIGAAMVVILVWSITAVLTRKRSR